MIRAAMVLLALHAPLVLAQPAPPTPAPPRCPTVAFALGALGAWEAPVLTASNAIVPGGPAIHLYGGLLVQTDRGTRFTIGALAGVMPSSDATAFDVGLHLGLRLGIRSDYLSGVIELDGGYRREQFHGGLFPDRDAVRVRAGLGASIHGAALPNLELGITPLALQLEHILVVDLAILSWAPRVWLAVWLG